ncbi:hypothetical protein HK096_006338 [Nowakowskiella sp. JEL0078]|nr:hypothetical protein HK096_006338 [Nowakowskiella sp. JEL0078]
MGQIISVCNPFFYWQVEIPEELKPLLSDDQIDSIDSAPSERRINLLSTALKSTLDAKVSENHRLLSEREALLTEKSVLKSENESLNTTISTLKADASGLRTNLHNVELERDQLKSKLETSLYTEHSQTREISNLEKKVALTKAENLALEEKAAVLHAETSELRIQLMSGEGHLNNLDSGTISNKCTNGFQAAKTLIRLTKKSVFPVIYDIQMAGYNLGCALVKQRLNSVISATCVDVHEDEHLQIRLRKFSLSVMQVHIEDIWREINSFVLHFVKSGEWIGPDSSRDAELSKTLDELRIVKEKAVSLIVVDHPFKEEAKDEDYNKKITKLHEIFVRFTEIGTYVSLSSQTMFLGSTEAVEGIDSESYYQSELISRFGTEGFPVFPGVFVKTREAIVTNSRFVVFSPPKPKTIPKEETNEKSTNVDSDYESVIKYETITKVIKIPEIVTETNVSIQEYAKIENDQQFSEQTEIQSTKESIPKSKFEVNIIKELSIRPEIEDSSFKPESTALSAEFENFEDIVFKPVEKGFSTAFQNSSYVDDKAEVRSNQTADYVEVEDSKLSESQTSDKTGDYVEIKSIGGSVSQGEDDKEETKPSYDESDTIINLKLETLGYGNDKKTSSYETSVSGSDYSVESKIEESIEDIKVISETIISAPEKATDLVQDTNKSAIVMHEYTQIETFIVPAEYEN